MSHLGLYAHQLALMHCLSGSLNPLLASIPPRIQEIDFGDATRRIWGGLGSGVQHLGGSIWGEGGGEG